MNQTQTDVHIKRLRRFELKFIMRALEINGLGDVLKKYRTLEVGCGDGYWLTFLKSRGCDIRAIELETSSFYKRKFEDVEYYSGEIFPIASKSVSVILSSHVLEHVTNLDMFLFECHRVVGDDGLMVHVIPNGNWKLWSFITHYLAIPKRILKIMHSPVSSVQSYGPVNRGSVRTLFRRFIINLMFPAMHGVTGNRFSEFYFFTRFHYRKTLISKQLFYVVHSFDIPIFYTDNMLFMKMPFHIRLLLARLFGGVSSCYVLRKIP
jgi:SAM-dependent methyltransferase